MAFDDLEALDAAILIDPAAFPGVELVRYLPKGSSTWREIYAQVDRDPPESVSGVELAAKPKVRIAVRNHATLGIALLSLNTAGDKLRYAREKGGDLDEADERIDMPIHARPVTQDAAMLVFEL